MTSQSVTTRRLAARGLAPASAENQSLIETFLERLWAEAGVSRHTLAAYRRDLEGLARWPGLHGAALDRIERQVVFAYLAQRTAAGYSARSNARLLSALRAFYGQLLRRGAISNDPSRDLAPPRIGRSLPKALSESEVEALLARVGREGPSTAELRTKMQTIMDRYCGVFRTDAVLAQGEQALAALAQEVAASAPGFAGRPFNTALTEHIELLGMMELARAVAASARARTESRGAHFRQDYPERDDAHFQKHTLARLDGGGIAIDYKPVRTQPLTVETFAPKPRVY